MLKKHIQKLVISSTITTDPYQILSEGKNFYYSSYKPKAFDKDSMKSFLNNLSITQLFEEQKLCLSCEGQISCTIEECKRILETFQIKTTSLQEMTESQLNSIKTVGILHVFVNHSLIALMSPPYRKKCPISKSKQSLLQ